jgi:hypothetical protein
MLDPSCTRILAPPPCPAPVPETTPAALLQALRADLLLEVAPRYGTAIAVVGTCTLLVTTLGLYVALCVAVFAIF